MPIAVNPGANLYWRPAAFVDSPIGLDGRCLRLSGGLQFFSAFEVIAVEDGRRTSATLLPVEELEDSLARLSDAQMRSTRETIVCIQAPRAALSLGERTIRLDQPQVASILNLTPDSFSGGGRFNDDPDGAVESAVAMAAAGAALIDVGGESTRPGAADVWEGDEIARVIPVIEKLAHAGVAVSIDTRKAAVMEAALTAGAAMVNDVSALLYDKRAAEVVAAAGCPVIVMHYPGPPADMHARDSYADPLIEVYGWLSDRVEALAERGIARERIVIDPGIGFGKNVQANLALINGLALFQGIGCAVMLGASRKRLIGALANEAPASERLGGSLALALAGVERGAQLLRVHDAAETVQALRVWRGLRDAALAGQRGI